ncbi:MAG: PhzF family phenazine biosynthesis protein [Pseudomonadota bacterium]|nr:PhzF family phenazine biosynthesis protein [Pseudomonadota bacterium]
MRPTPRQFHQLDVFSSERLKGNPLAVVHDAEGLDDATMLAFARWTNLSETTFLLSPSAEAAELADYRVRIYTPGGELPFAGHPTLGSCYAWLAAGGRPREEGFVVQECGVGLVRIRRGDPGHPERLAFAAPPLRRTGPLADDLVARLVQGLAIDPADVLAHQWVDNGPGWCALMLRSAAQVLSVRLDPALLGDVKLGLLGAQPSGHEALFEVRAFVPGLGVAEDPVTGSLNAGLAQWLIGAGLAPPRYLVAQGTALGRNGRVHVQQQDGVVWIGGDVAICVAGHLSL